jgi:hypothetical protein
VSTDTINSTVLSAQIVHQTNFAPTNDYVNKL